MSKPYGVIYCVTNLANDKYYIGQTTADAGKRFINHIAEATAGRSGCKYFHAAIRKYGRDSFSVTTLGEAENAADLHNLERLWIILTNATTRSIGYNIDLGGRGPGKLNEQTKEKIRQTLTGRTLPPEHVENARLAGIGKKRSQETKDRISAALLKPEVREKLRNTHLGRKKTPEHIEKVRLSQVGRTVSAECRAKMSAAAVGRKVSPETKEKIRLGMLALRKAQREARQSEQAA